MNQVVVSYVLSKIAKIADVHPKDIHTSFFSGNIEIKNLAIRVDTIARLAPIVIESCTIASVKISIPNPATANPLAVEVDGISVVLPVDPFAKSEVRKLEDVLSDITIATILGEAIHDSGSERGTSKPQGNNQSSSSSSSTTSSSVSVNGDAHDEDGDVVGEDEMSALSSEVDDLDLASCRSDAESEASEMLNDGDVGGAGVGDARRGIFSLLRDRATKTVEWIWQRQLRINVMNTSVVLLCDSHRRVRLHVGKASVVVEPTRVAGKERLKMVEVEIGDVGVDALESEESVRCVLVEDLRIRNTRVLSLVDEPLRDNTTIQVMGAVRVMATEPSIAAAVDCYSSHEVARKLPMHCRPFVHLHGPTSRWRYAKECVLAMIHDRRRRYNLNLSHLRFFAQARDRYLQLLDTCHRSQSVYEQRAKLAEAEQDLIYVDVIAFLRRRVQQKYGAAAASSPTETDATTKNNTSKGGSSSTPNSIHVDVELLELVLPASRSIALRQAAVVVRRDEVSINLANVDVVAGLSPPRPLYVATNISTNTPTCARAGKTSDGSVAPFCAINIKNTASATMVRAEIGNMCLDGTTAGLLAVAAPLLRVRQQLDIQPSQQVFYEAEVPPQPTSPASTSAVAASPTSPPPRHQSITVVFAGMRVSMDSLVCVLEQGSMTLVSRADDRPKLGCNVQHLSISFGNQHLQTDYLVAPVHVSMLANDDINISPIRLRITGAAFQWMMETSNLCSAALAPPTTMKDEEEVVRSLVPTPTTSTASSRPRMAMTPARPFSIFAAGRTHPPSLLAKAQSLRVEGLALGFDPLNLEVHVGEVRVRPGMEGVGRGCGTVSATAVLIQVADLRATITEPVSSSVVEMRLVDGMRVFSVLGSSEATTAIDLSPLVGRCIDSRGGEVAVLLHLTNGRVDLHDGLTLITATLRLFDAVEVAEFSCLMKNHPSHNQTDQRPYQASFVQVYCRLGEVVVEPLSRAPFHVFTAVGDRVAAFLGQLTPLAAYRVFDSGMSDLALMVEAERCRIHCGSEGVVELSLHVRGARFSAEQAQRFGPLLPSLEHQLPLILSYDCEALTFSTRVEELRLAVYPPHNVSEACLSLTCEEVALLAPIGKMDFWAEEVLEQLQQQPLRLRVHALSAHLFGDRQEDMSKCLAQLRISSVEVERNERAVVAGGGGHRNLSSSPVDSELGSCTSTDVEELPLLTATIGRWLCAADTSLHDGAYIHVAQLVSYGCRVGAMWERHMLLTCCQNDLCLDLNTQGNIVFHAPQQILRVERCTILAASPTSQVLITDGTTVVFRECIFDHPSGVGCIQTSSDAGLFVLEGCTSQHAAVKDAVVATGVQPAARRQRANLRIVRGDVKLKLAPDSSIVLSHSTLTAQVDQKPKSPSYQVRMEDVQAHLVTPKRRLRLAARITLELELSMKKLCPVVNCTLTTEEVSIPVLLPHHAHVLHVAALLRAHTQLPSPAWAPATPVARASADMYPYPKWKVLLSVSLVPLQLVLEDGSIVAKLTLSNAFLWSIREHGAEEASTEARIALAECSVLDASTQLLAPLLERPVYLGGVGRLTRRGADVHLNVSEGSISVTAHHLRLFAGLARMMSAEPREEDRAPVRITNESGCLLVVRGPQGTLIDVGAMEDLSLRELPVSAVLCVASIQQSPVEQTKTISIPEALYGVEEAMAASSYLLAARDGQWLHLLTTLNPHCVQHWVVRTLFQLRNDTDFDVLLRGTQCEDVMIPRHSVGCVPHGMLQQPNVGISLTGISGGSGRTLREALFKGDESPQHVMERLATEGSNTTRVEHNLECVSEVNGSRYYIRLCMERLQGEVVMCFLSPAFPILRNDTSCPLKVAIVDERQSHRAIVEMLPHTSVHVYQLSDAEPFECTLSMETDAGTFLSQDKSSVRELLLGEEGSVVLGHELHPKRYFIELNAVLTTPEGQRTRQCTLAPSHLARVVNQCRDALYIISEAGDVVGTQREEDGIAPMKSAYVPMDTTLQLKTCETEDCEVFELERGFAGATVVCGVASTTEAVASHAFFVLLRPIAAPNLLVELLPPLFIINEGPLSLHLRHTVVRSEKLSKDEREPSFAHLLQLAPHSTTGYHTLAKYGASDYVALSLEGTTSSIQPPTLLDLSVGAHWSAVLRLDRYHVRITVTKPHAHASAFMHISAPCSPFLRVINLSPTAFDGLGPLELRTYATAEAPPKGQAVLLRRVADGLTHKLDHSDACIDAAKELEPDLVVYTVGDVGERTLVLCSSSTLNDGALRIMARLRANKLGLSANLHMGRLQLQLSLAQNSHVQLVVQSISLWGESYQRLSAQANLVGLHVSTTYKDHQHFVLEPMGVDVSLRDVAITPHRLSIRALQVSVHPMTITVSDVFLYQLQQTLKQATVGLATVPCYDPTQRASTLYHRPTPPPEQLRLSIDGVSVSEVVLELSWDRSVSPPADYVMHSIAVLALVPSLHHAAIRLPSVQSSKLTFASLNDCLLVLRQQCTMEVLKQLPRAIASVGLFKKNASMLDRLRTTISSVIFRSPESENTSHGATLL